MDSSQFKFSCGILDTINGYKLKAITPDANGFYDICVGCIGAPTQNSVIYDPESTIAAMNDPKSRFNISLREGYLCGEWGHPVIDDPRDPKQMRRLLQIDEHNISHYFGKIWIDNEHPVQLGNGETGYRIMAKVKPSGPNGAFLERSLQDPHANTSFSVRCVCLPMAGPRKECEYRKVALMVTFDAVHAPGFEIANKRYSSLPGMEAWNEYDFDKNVAETAISKLAVGMESNLMIDKPSLRRLYNEKEIITTDNKLVGINVSGRRSVMSNGSYIDAASLIYGK